jgi:hypothetical protein
VIGLLSKPLGSGFSDCFEHLTQNATHWIFKSDNHAYEPVRVPKNEIAHPILDVMVERLS